MTSYLSSQHHRVAHLAFKFVSSLHLHRAPSDYVSVPLCAVHHYYYTGSLNSVTRQLYLSLSLPLSRSLSLSFSLSLSLSLSPSLSVRRNCASTASASPDTRKASGGVGGAGVPPFAVRGASQRRNLRVSLFEGDHEEGVGPLCCSCGSAVYVAGTSLDHCIVSATRHVMACLGGSANLVKVR